MKNRKPSLKLGLKLGLKLSLEPGFKLGLKPSLFKLSCYFQDICDDMCSKFMGFGKPFGE